MIKIIFFSTILILIIIIMIYTRLKNKKFLGTTFNGKVHYDNDLIDTIKKEDMEKSILVIKESIEDLISKDKNDSGIFIELKGCDRFLPLRLTKNGIHLIYPFFIDSENEFVRINKILKEKLKEISNDVDQINELEFFESSEQIAANLGTNSNFITSIIKKIIQKGLLITNFEIRIKKLSDK